MLTNNTNGRLKKTVQHPETSTFLEFEDLLIQCLLSCLLTDSAYGLLLEAPVKSFKIDEFTLLKDTFTRCMYNQLSGIKGNGLESTVAFVRT